MWDFIYKQVLPWMGVFLVGFISWWVTNWIAHPIVDFERTRRLTREELNFWKHLNKDWKQDKIDQGEDSLRRLSARIEAADATAGLTGWYFKCRGYNLEKACSALSGLANVKGRSRDDRTVLKNEVELALKLPTSEPQDRINRINERIENN